ncbi:MAG: flagellar hook-length control protein FliK [Erysipelotrichaceae bacterium]
MNVMMQMVASMLQTQQVAITQPQGEAEQGFAMLLDALSQSDEVVEVVEDDNEVDTTLMDASIHLPKTMPQDVLLVDSAETTPVQTTQAQVTLFSNNLPEEVVPVAQLESNSGLAAVETVELTAGFVLPEVEPEQLETHTLSHQQAIVEVIREPEIKEWTQAKLAMEAQQLLKPKQHVDVKEELQQLQSTPQVEARPFTNVEQSKAAIQPKAVLEQFEQGLASKLQSTQDEFVIKLKPEGLGELVVKIAQQEGKTSLVLAASNKEVSHLMQAHSQELKQVLATYQVEHVVVESMSEMQAQYQEQTSQHKPNFYKMEFEHELEEVERLEQVSYEDGHMVTYV